MNKLLEWEGLEEEAEEAASSLGKAASECWHQGMAPCFVGTVGVYVRPHCVKYLLVTNEAIL